MIAMADTLDDARIEHTGGWTHRSPWVRYPVGMGGSMITLFAFWSFALEPLGWPPITQVGHYFAGSIVSWGSYLDALMTGGRAVAGMAVGFVLAVILGLLTGRSTLGWILFFFLMMLVQKIPAVAMVHVYVGSALGIGNTMTVALAATVVLSFTWIIIHHRAATLNPQEIFALRVVGLRGIRLAIFGLAPHLGSTIGASLRLAAGIALVITVIGEWQGLWDDGTILSHGLGVSISRAYESIDSEARVLAACLWLGLLGIIFDGAIQVGLRLLRRATGIDFRR